MNEATNRLLGYEKDELVKIDLCELIVDEKKRDTYLDTLRAPERSG